MRCNVLSKRDSGCYNRGSSPAEPRATVSVRTWLGAIYPVHPSLEVACGLSRW